MTAVVLLPALIGLLNVILPVPEEPTLVPPNDAIAARKATIWASKAEIEAGVAGTAGVTVGTAGVAGTAGVTDVLPPPPPLWAIGPPLPPVVEEAAATATPQALALTLTEIVTWAVAVRAMEDSLVPHVIVSFASGASVDMRFLPAEATVKVDPDCRTTVKLVSPTTIDSTASVAPETVRVTALPRELLMEIAAVEVSETSLYAAKVRAGKRAMLRPINNFFIDIVSLFNNTFDNTYLAMQLLEGKEVEGVNSSSHRSTGAGVYHLDAYQVACC